MEEISQNINTVINILKLIPPIKSESAALAPEEAEFKSRTIAQNK